MKKIPVLAMTLALLASEASFSDGGDSYADSRSELSSVARLIKNKNYEKATRQLKRIIANDRTDADAWNLLGFASRKYGDFNAAENAYEQALLLQPDHRGALEYQGELFIRQGKLNAARKNLQALIALCPSGCDELINLQASLDAL